MREESSEESGGPESAPEVSSKAALGWLLAWLLSYMTATLLFKLHVVLPGGTSWIVALVPSAVGVVGIVRYLIFLYTCTGSQRRPHLLALALGFCGGAFFILGYRLIERAGAPPLDFNDPFVVMAALWAVGLFVASRRPQFLP